MLKIFLACRHLEYQFDEYSLPENYDEYKPEPKDRESFQMSTSLCWPYSIERGVIYLLCQWVMFWYPHRTQLSSDSPCRQQSVSTNDSRASELLCNWQLTLTKSPVRLPRWKCQRWHLKDLFSKVEPSSETTKVARWEQVQIW